MTQTQGKTFTKMAGPNGTLSQYARAIGLTILCLLFAAAPSLRAQDNATISGTITDVSGAVVPNAAISLLNPATGQSRDTVSNSVGAYRFANVGVGTYTLIVTATGFQKFTRTGIVVNVAQSLGQDVALTVGSQSQTVTVAADALQIQSESNEISSLISGEQVTQLATNGRNVTALAALGMGKSNTLSDFSGVNALTSSNGISFNGTRPSHNIYMVDGGELNDRGCGGCFSSLPSMDAMAEFQTLDSNYSADYGIGSGGTILMVLKSGTRNFHGSVWEFNRNEAYGATNYFTKLNKGKKPMFRLNEPGFNLGGPLWIPHVYNESKSRTFWFVNEEWRKLKQGVSPSTYNTIAANNFPTAGQPFTYTVPSNGKTPTVPWTCDPALVGAGYDCAAKNPNPAGGLYLQDGLKMGEAFPNNTIPANLIDPNAVLMMTTGTFPKPNFGTSQYIASPPQPTDVREDLVRIDHTINSKFQLMGHFLHDAMNQTYYPPLWNGSIPVVGSSMLNPSYSAVIKLTQTYSPTLLNETAVLYSGNKIHLAPVGTYAQPSGWSQTTYFPAANNRLHRMPEIQLGAPYGVTWSPSYFPWKNGYEGFQYRDDLSWTNGRHQFKFGASWLHTYKNQELQANTQGTAVFNDSTFTKDSYVNFLMGMTATWTQLEYLWGKNWVNNNYSFYAIDNWHAGPRLTFNLGFRYDGMPHAFERYDKFSNFVVADYDRTQIPTFNSDNSMDTNSPGFSTYNNTRFYLNGIRLAGVGGFPRGNVHNYYNTYQPRLGFAWDIFGNGKTVLRAGAGIFYERVQGNDVYNAALNPPFAYQPSSTSVYFSNPNKSATDGAVSSGNSRFPSSLTNLDYSFKSPGQGMYSLGIQREIAPSIIAVVQYVGTAGWNQSDNRAINTLPLLDSSNSHATRQSVAGGAAANKFRQYLGYAGITQEENRTNATYNSLQTGIRIEKRHGLTVQASYTWSHEIDIVSYDLNGVANPFNLRYSRGSGGLDRRHIFNTNYIYDLPIFRTTDKRLLRTTLGGWQFSGVTVVQTGIPVQVTYGTDVLGLGGGTTNRPNLRGKVSYPKKRTAWFDKSAFSAPVAPWEGGPNQGFGTAGKDSVVGPGRINFNLSLFKTFPLTPDEKTRLELRFESFNTFNHTQFNGLSAGYTNSDFGNVTSAWDPRNMQLAGKIIF